MYSTINHTAWPLVSHYNKNVRRWRHNAPHERAATPAASYVAMFPMPVKSSQSQACHDVLSKIFDDPILSV
jgi:hypothetical protein